MCLLKIEKKGNVYNLLFSGACSFFSVAPMVGRCKEDWRSHQMCKLGKVTNADGQLPIRPVSHTTNLCTLVKLEKAKEKRESSCAERWPKS